MDRLLDPKRKRPFCNAFTGNCHCSRKFSMKHLTLTREVIEEWLLLGSDDVQSSRLLPTFRINLVSPASWTLKADARNCSETLETIYRATWRHIQEDNNNLHSHQRERTSKSDEEKKWACRISDNMINTWKFNSAVAERCWFAWSARNESNSDVMAGQNVSLFC
jgi:hypothetical protein